VVENAAYGVVGFFFPYWTRNIFQFQKDYTTRIHVPNYAPEMKQYIETNTNAQARILVMPKLDEGFIGAPLDTSVWGFYSLAPLASLSTNRTIVYNGLGGLDVISSLYDQFEKGNDEAFLKMIRILGITHILYRTDVRLSESFKKTTLLSFWEKAINQKKDYIQSLRVSEIAIRQTQFKLSQVKLFYENYVEYPQIFKEIADQTPPGVKFINVAMETQENKVIIRINAQAQSSNDISNFTQGLKTSQHFKDVGLTTLNVEQNIIKFTLNLSAPIKLES